MTTQQRAWTANLDTAEFEPYIEGGEQIGEVHWIRQEFTEDGEPLILVGVMRQGPETPQEAVEYEWVTDETIQVLEGQVEVDVDGQETLTLGVGDVASFRQGSKGVFRSTPPYTQFFVMTRRP